jgi:orotate phosphoribosyltransferase
MSAKEDVARILLEVEAVTLNPKKPYRYTSGILSPIYCDNRLLMSHVRHREKIVDCFIKTIQDEGLTFNVVGGVATSGIPHAAWISDKLKKPMIYIRPKKKTHGKENLIEGKLEKGQKVLVVEDLISTGGSSVSSVESVRNAGGIAEDCIAIFTYGLEKAKENFREARCRLLTLTDFETLVKVAENTGYITPEEKVVVLQWNKEPENWGRKMGFE